MLLDPLTALSLAGTVVQFVDFTSKILSKGTEVYRSLDGALVENLEIQSIVEDLISLNDRLVTSVKHDGGGPKATRNSNKQLSLDEQALESLAGACSDIAHDLLERLERLKMHGEKKKWKSLYTALKGVWSKAEIEDLLERLSRYRDELELHLLVNIKSQIDVKAFNEAEIFDKMDRSAQLMITYMAENQNNIATQLAMQEKMISRFQETSLTQMDQQHERTRAELREILDRLENKESLWGPSGPTVEEPDGPVNWWFTTPAQKIQMKDVRDSLWISTLDDRFDQITEAHSRHGAYWINGKPGPGKSTLVKFLYQDRRTEVALKEWGCDDEVVTAGFYFWNSGMRRQRNEESMLRSLLFRSMRKREDLISVVLEEHLTPATYRKLKIGKLQWSLAQLRRCFTKLVHQELIKIKLVFMIDGLDEFEGNHLTFAEWLLSLTSPSIKMIFSSRPWNVFRDAFQSLPQLRVQDLTHGDITAYVEDHLNGNPRMNQLSQKDPEQAEALITEIVSKASGVFLWVRIVVGSLLDGLMNYDKISDLQTRLSLVPDDLDALYKHILSQSESMYYIRRSQYLLMRQAYDEPPLTLAFSLADEDDPEICFKTEMKLISKGEALDRCEEIERRLQASCAGLLEVDYRAKTLLSQSERERQLQNHDYYRSAYGSKIQFMHRTVKDFFENKERITEICSVVEGTSFDPYVALLQGWILRLKVLPTHFLGLGSMQVGGPGNVETLYCEGMKFAEMAEKNTGVTQKVLINELKRVVTDLYNNWKVVGGSILPSSSFVETLEFVKDKEQSTPARQDVIFKGKNSLQESASIEQSPIKRESEVVTIAEPTITKSGAGDLQNATSPIGKRRKKLLVCRKGCFWFHLK